MLSVGVCPSLLPSSTGAEEPDLGIELCDLAAAFSERLFGLSVRRGSVRVCVCVLRSHSILLVLISLVQRLSYVIYPWYFVSMWSGGWRTVPRCSFPLFWVLI